MVKRCLVKNKTSKNPLHTELLPREGDFPIILPLFPSYIFFCKEVQSIRM